MIFLRLCPCESVTFDDHWLIDEFQLFKKPHPPKRVRSRLNGEAVGASVPPGSTGDKIFFHHLDNLRPSLAPVKGKL